MNVLSQTTRLKSALDRFEQVLTHKLVDNDGDEVRQWAYGVKDALELLEEVVARQRLGVHEKFFDTVANQHEGELEHIRELKAADARVEQLLEIVRDQMIVCNVEAAAEVEPRLKQEPFCEASRQEMVACGFELIHWIREQEALVTTWFLETFTR